MKTRLTKSEMEIMEVLWDEGKALTTSEIIQRSKEKEKEWKDSSDQSRDLKKQQKIMPGLLYL